MKRRRIAPARVMKSVLRKTRVPPYLCVEFLRATPDRLSKETGSLLITYLRLSVRTSRSGAVLDTEAFLANLLSRWSAEGGASADLLKLIKMADYRRQALRPSPTEKQPDEADTAALSRFWVSSGHDIEELSVFLSDVDHEAADWLPQ